MQSRSMQIGIVLAVVALVLVFLASATGWPGWLIVVLFVVASAVTILAWPGKRTDD